MIFQVIFLGTVTLIQIQDERTRDAILFRRAIDQFSKSLSILVSSIYFVVTINLKTEISTKTNSFSQTSYLSRSSRKPRVINLGRIVTGYLGFPVILVSLVFEPSRATLRCTYYVTLENCSPGGLNLSTTG